MRYFFQAVRLARSASVTSSISTASCKGAIAAFAFAIRADSVAVASAFSSATDGAGISAHAGNPSVPVNGQQFTKVLRRADVNIAFNVLGDGQPDQMAAGSLGVSNQPFHF